MNFGCLRVLTGFQGHLSGSLGRAGWKGRRRCAGPTAKESIEVFVPSSSPGLRGGGSHS